MSFKVIVLALLSAGWLFPAFVTYSWFIASKDPRNSFPFLQSSAYMFGVTCVWLGIVIALWSGLLAAKLVSKEPK
jgi:hypothetical protein